MKKDLEKQIAELEKRVLALEIENLKLRGMINSIHSVTQQPVYMPPHLEYMIPPWHKPMGIDPNNDKKRFL